MLHDIEPKKYHVEYHGFTPAPDDAVLIYQGRKVLIRTDQQGLVFFPKMAEFRADMTYQYLFAIDREKYFLGTPGGDFLPEGYSFENLEFFRSAHPDDARFAAVTGWQLYDWHQGHRFCGSCGKPLVHDQAERMMKCPSCGRIYYPVICPGVIVAVTHHGRLLMTRYRGRSYTNYALIAGFNESGESIEQTVHREVMEEVGLRVKNLRFYKSQPWPFSDTLLMGFFCELDGEDESIKLEADELSEAGWYLPEDVPADREHASLTSEMMTVFRREHGFF